MVAFPGLFLVLGVAYVLGSKKAAEVFAYGGFRGAILWIALPLIALSTFACYWMALTFPLLSPEIWMWSTCILVGAIMLAWVMGILTNSGTKEEGDHGCSYKRVG